MKYKAKRHGFTLIEIIVSLAIFSIISVGFYSLFTVVFINTYKTSDVTEATFLAQRELEDEIASVKERITHSETIDEYSLTSYTLFSDTEERTVSGYHLVMTGSGSAKLESLVAQQRPPQLQVPTLYPFTIAAFNVENNVTIKKQYPTIDMENLSIDIEGSLSTSNDGLIIRYLYYWYVSDDSGYMPHEEPVFPDNYALIPGQTTRTLSSIPQEYGGRFLKLVVTPVGEKGRMGESVISNTIYISQFNKSSNLLLRLDGSFINPDDEDQVTTTGVDFYVKRWLGVVPENLRNYSSSVSTPYLSRITITREDVSNTVTAITSDVSQTKSVATGEDLSLRSNTNTSIYASIRLSSGLNSDIIVFETPSTRDGWRLRFDAASNEFILERYINRNLYQTTVDVESLINDSWLFVKMDVLNNKIALDINGTIQNETLYSMSRSYHTTPLVIRVNDKVTIGDLIVYEGIHSTEDRDEVYDYLEGKYYP